MPDGATRTQVKLPYFTERGAQELLPKVLMGNLPDIGNSELALVYMLLAPWARGSVGTNTIRGSSAILRRLFFCENLGMKVLRIAVRHVSTCNIEAITQARDVDSV